MIILEFTAAEGALPLLGSHSSARAAVMMAVALALARSAPSRHARRACSHSACRRSRSASASTSASARSSLARAPWWERRARHQGWHPSARRARSTAATSALVREDLVPLPAPGDVHLWLMDPDDARDPELLAEYERRCLAPEESAAIRDDARPMTESARTQVIHSKAFMRCVLARYCHPAVHPANLRFEHGEHGKPALVAVASPDELEEPDDPARPAASRSTPASLPPLRFSLSHCSRLVALAVTTAPSEAADAPAPRGLPRPYAATHEVGVDCEDERRRTSAAADKLAKRWLSASEAAALADIADGDERAAAFMRLWTLKEAYVKALGTGIAAHPLSGFDVETKEDPSVGAGEIVLTERTPGANDLEGEGWMSSAGGWRFMLVRAREGDGLIAAVCVWAGVDDDDDDEDEEEGGGAERGPTVSVRWTVPLRGDFEPGEKPPPVILAASAN